MPEKTKLIFNVNSNLNIIYKSIKVSPYDEEIKKIDKNRFKNLSLLGKYRLLRKGDYNESYIFCRNIDEQSNLIWLKILGYLIKSKKTWLADEKGKTEILASRFILVAEFLSYLFGLICAYSIVFNISVFIYLIIHLRRIILRSIFEKEIRNIHEIVYLRTDFSNEKVGGAIRHIQGFINASINKKIFIYILSPSKISVIDNNNCKNYIIKPWRIFNKLYVELTMILYNFKYVYYGYKILNSKKFDFIYQRFSSLNCSGAILSILLRKKLVLEFNSSSLWKTSRHSKIRFKITRHVMEKLSLLYAFKIIVVSNEMKRRLVCRGIRSEKILVNTNGVDINQFNPDKVGKIDLNKEYNIEKKYIAGFSGVFSQWHGLETLIDSIQYVINEYTDVHFLIIGDGVIRSKLQKQLLENGNASNATFTGKVKMERMPFFLNSCDMLISPHRNMADGKTFFGSPIKIFEYMAMEKAIIASNVGQLKEVLKDRENAIIVSNDNPKMLASAILELIKNQKLRKYISMNARRMANEKYTWEHNVERLINCMYE